MKPWGLIPLAVATACSSSSAPSPPSPPSPPPPLPAPPTPTEPAPPPEVAVLFERILGGWEQAPPLFGPDGGVTVDTRQWTRDGKSLGRHAVSFAGQTRTIAATGTPAHPLILAVDYEQGQTRLIAAERMATKPAYATPTGHDFLDDNLTLSPDHSLLAMVEGDDLVVRAVPAGAVIARTALGATEDEPIPCWVDGGRVAWIAHSGQASELRTLAVRARTVAYTPLAVPSTMAACDPAGGAAATFGAGAVGVLDLASGKALASVTVSAEDFDVAVGERGQRLAIATPDAVTLYHRDGAHLSLLFANPQRATRPAKLAFSGDGQRLAIAGPTLLVLGPKAEARALPPAHRFAFELPKGFTEVTPETPESDAWRYAQLPTPSGARAWPSTLVNARRDRGMAEVVALSLEHDEFGSVPDLHAPDAELASFGQRAMAQLFDQWHGADLEESGTFTLHVAHIKGLPVIDTREVWRDGCEPYDGYTRIVIDLDAVYVVRAITIPGGPIDGWLQRFFALPFGLRTQTALRRGPSMGPC